MYIWCKSAHKQFNKIEKTLRDIDAHLDINSWVILLYYTAEYITKLNSFMVQLRQVTQIVKAISWYINILFNTRECHTGNSFSQCIAGERRFHILMWKVDRKSGARSITCSNSKIDNLPSPSTSASSITLSAICWCSSGLSSFLVIVVRQDMRSACPMKPSWSKSAKLCQT